MNSARYRGHWGGECSTSGGRASLSSFVTRSATARAARPTSTVGYVHAGNVGCRVFPSVDLKDRWIVELRAGLLPVDTRAV